MHNERPRLHFVSLLNVKAGRTQFCALLIPTCLCARAGHIRTCVRSHTYTQHKHAHHLHSQVAEVAAGAYRQGSQAVNRTLQVGALLLFYCVRLSTPLWLLRTVDARKGVTFSLATLVMRIRHTLLLIDLPSLS